MLKIKKLRICSKGSVQNELRFENVTYIHGPNKKGKTLIVKLIDFILGSSTNLLKQSPQGLEGIDFVEADFVTDNGEITLARDGEDSFYYKMNKDELSKIDKKFYSNLISECLCSFDNSILESYNNVFGEKLSFRALTFLNFLEETGIGNLACVFTEVNQPKHMFRASQILQFAFERKRIERIAKLEEDLNKKEKEFRDTYKDDVANDFYISGLKTLLKKYNLSYSNDMHKNIDQINEFKISLLAKEKPSDGDLNYLVYKSNDLANQIRTQSELANQSQKIMNRNANFKELASNIEKIFKDAPFSDKYLGEIQKILDDNNYSDCILSLKDYKATIGSLKKEKKEYDAKISEIKNNLSNTSFGEKMADVNQMLEYCSRIKESYSIRDSKTIENEIKMIKDLIKEEKNKIQSTFSQLNFNITKKYLSTKNNNLIKEEKEKSDFRVVFNYKNISSYGEYSLNGKRMSLFPGSSAKMAYWQLCIYLETIKYFKRNLPQMPLLNVIVIDGLNQPFDDESDKDNYLSTILAIIDSFKEYGIQAIIISTDRTIRIKETIEEVGIYYGIDNGLNPLHNN